MVVPHLPYDLQHEHTRRIPKFNVEGREYRFRAGIVPADTAYEEAVQAIHDMIGREYALQAV